MVSPLTLRSAVKYLVKQMGSSQRRVCIVMGLSRSLVSYIAKRRRDEAELIKKIHKLAIRNSGMATVGLRYCSGERAGE